MDNDKKLGATGRFTDGKLNESDEGELRFGIGISDGNVIVEFGKPVVWLGLPPDRARALATMLISKADEIEG